MVRQTPPYETAGRVFRFFAWVQLFVIAVIFFALLLPPMITGKPHLPTHVHAASLLVVLVGIAFNVFQLKVGAAIREHKEWGRTAGLILAVIQLFGFPIGTIVGAFLIWCLVSGWDSSSRTQPATSPS